MQKVMQRNVPPTLCPDAETLQRNKVRKCVRDSSGKPGARPLRRGEDLERIARPERVALSVKTPTKAPEGEGTRPKELRDFKDMRNNDSFRAFF